MNKIKQKFRPLTEAQIEYLNSISLSEKNDAMRGMRLLAECSYHTLCINCTYYREKDEDLFVVLEDIRSDYEDLAKKGLLKQEPNTFGCSFEELDERIEHIIVVSEEYNKKANRKDYDLCKMFIEFYGTPALFRKQYSIILKNCSGDIRFEKAEPALDQFDELYRCFDSFYQSGYVSDVKKRLDNEEMYRLFPKASSIVYEYIKSKDSCCLDAFLRKIGITKAEFQNYVNIVKKLNGAYYEKFLASQNLKAEELEEKYVRDLIEIYEGITTGLTKNGEPFDTLEFVKLLPYKDKGDFYIKVKKLLLERLPNMYQTIVDYMCANNITTQFYFQATTKKYCRKIETSYPNSVAKEKYPLTDDMDVAFDYLDYYGIAPSKYTVKLVLDKFHAGNINVAELYELRTKREEEQKAEKERFTRLREVEVC